ncbi:hypothetical protein [Mycobacterium bourgelatii]|uniref:hypothetical protein n=1 Tax=Mycobacterium bourgelatii TaxID=1273442 RepID=UPI0013D05184|nr:hypothetical protein [Mycobacterium bourgelatii]MCV6972993.1 hypothetical protein [Mycobacterium bourgelatii]
MNVGDSVRQSLDHWARQDWDTAMYHACDAIKGTGKKRYPQQGVATAFRRTIRDGLDIFHAMAAPAVDFEKSRFPIQVKTDLPDGRPDIADVLYGIHRYGHGHTDDLPKGFEITRHGSRDTNISIWREGKIQLPAATVLGLLAVAVFAPENKGEHAPINYKLSWYQHEFQISGWWGWQDHFREIIGSAQFSRKVLDFDNRWDSWSPF